MNPYLEKALIVYYEQKRKRMWIAFGVSLALVAIATCWMLLTKPEEGFFSREGLFSPASALGLVGVVGVVGALWWLLMGGNDLLLRILREEPRSLRAVRRGETVFKGQRTGVEYHRVPTLFVDLLDGRTVSLHVAGDLELFARLQKLLEKQIDESRTASS